jgi:hypothetical protein
MHEIPPPPPDLEAKFQRSAGIVIGIALGVLLVGLLGLLIANLNYNDVARYVNYNGTRNGDWLFRRLTNQIATFSSLSIAGAITLFWGWLTLRRKKAKQMMFKNNPIRNGMIGGGGAMAFYSLTSLFMYLFTGDSLQLWLFLPPFIIGVVLVSFGFSMKRQ